MLKIVLVFLLLISVFLVSCSSDYYSYADQNNRSREYVLFKTQVLYSYSEERSGNFGYGESYYSVIKFRKHNYSLYSGGRNWLKCGENTANGLNCNSSNNIVGFLANQGDSIKIEAIYDKDAATLLIIHYWFNQTEMQIPSKEYNEEVFKKIDQKQIKGMMLQPIN